MKRDFLIIKAISGFTLVELMISLVLGLLISAAVIQIYFINTRTSSVQKGAGELQDASIFGLQMLENHIRLANLGNTIHQINDTTPNGGIVFSPLNLNLNASTFPTSDYLTHSTGDSKHGDTNGWKGISNTDIASDQLTLQFTNVTGTALSDCEGSTIDNGETVIERYFLRVAPASVATNTNTTKTQNLALACDAGRVTADGVIIGGHDPRNFGQAGQEFIANVDQFNFLLGVQSVDNQSTSTIYYVTPHEYITMHSTNSLGADNGLVAKPVIISVRLGIIAHGSTPLIGIEDVTDFKVLGKNNSLKSDPSRKKYIRTVYESTILLRNARVIRIEGIG